MTFFEQVKFPFWLARGHVLRSDIFTPPSVSDSLSLDFWCHCCTILNRDFKLHSLLWNTMKILIISVFSPDQYRTALCNTIFLSTVLNVHVPEFQIYGEDTAFIYNNVQLCALKISVLNYMFKVRYMYENSNLILYQRVMIVVPEISKVKLKKIAWNSNSTPICIYPPYHPEHTICNISFRVLALLHTQKCSVYTW
jgi:hypothetical protein